ncbi:UNVERIFIED_CONTAM: hypothetical protein FKN15_067378 [Acipenser sinensis]
MDPGTSLAHTWAPETRRGVSAVRQMVPGTSPAIARAPSTRRGVPAARQKVPGTSPKCARGPATSRRSQQLANGPWNIPSIRTDPSDQVWSRSSSPNGLWHLPSARTNPSVFARSPSGLQMVPDTSPACARATATSRRVPAAHKSSLEHPQRVHGPQRPGVESQQLAKWSLAPPQHTQAPETPCGVQAPHQMVPGTSIPSACTGPSEFARGTGGLPNGPWHLPSRHTGPRNPARDPSGSPNVTWHIHSAHTGPSDFERGPTRSQMVPDTSPAPTQAPATSRGVPAACQMVPGPSTARNGVPSAHQMIPSTSLARTRAPETPCGLPEARQIVPGTSPAWVWATATRGKGHAGSQRHTK